MKKMKVKNKKKLDKQKLRDFGFVRHTLWEKLKVLQDEGKSTEVNKGMKNIRKVNI